MRTSVDSPPYNIIYMTCIRVVLEIHTVWVIWYIENIVKAPQDGTVPVPVFLGTSEDNKLKYLMLRPRKRSSNFKNCLGVRGRGRRGRWRPVEAWKIKIRDINNIFSNHCHFVTKLTVILDSGHFSLWPRLFFMNSEVSFYWMWFSVLFFIKSIKSQVLIFRKRHVPKNDGPIFSNFHNL